MIQFARPSYYYDNVYISVVYNRAIEEPFNKSEEHHYYGILSVDFLSVVKIGL